MEDRPRIELGPFPRWVSLWEDWPVCGEAPPLPPPREEEDELQEGPACVWVENRASRVAA